MESLEKLTRREALHIGGLAFAGLALDALAPGILEGKTKAPKIVDSLSRFNAMRSSRKSTQYVILHTTEGRYPGCLDVIKKGGLANFLVTKDGKIYRTVHEDKVAKHAGRSMWNGTKELSKVSVGIEVEGNWDIPLTGNQLSSLKGLLDYVQTRYKIPDRNVLPHAVVAYGFPNAYHPYFHRGRRKDHPSFLDERVRKSIGLTSHPAYDPDVAAGRVRYADKALEELFWGTERNRALARSDLSRHVSNIISATNTAWDIAGEQYDDPTTEYRYPNGTKRKGSDMSIRDFATTPAGTIVKVGASADESEDFVKFKEIGVHGKNAWQIAYGAYDDATTIYFLNNGWIRTGKELSQDQLDMLPNGTRVLVGYVYGGHVRKGKRFPRAIAGNEWNYPSTVYVLPGRNVKTGDEIDDRTLPDGTLVLFRD